MPRADDVLLDVHRVIAERILRFAPGRVQRRRQSRRARARRACPSRHRRQPLSAAPDSRTARRCAPLRPHRVSADVVPGTTGTFAAMASWRAAVLLPIAAMASAGGPMNVSPSSRTRRANHSRSDEKAVAGMDGLGAHALGGSHDPVAAEIALGGRRRAQVARLRRPRARAAPARRRRCRPRPSATPSSRHARTTRSAISPRLAMSTLVNITAECCRASWADSDRACARASTARRSVAAACRAGR